MGTKGTQQSFAVAAFRFDVGEVEGAEAFGRRGGLAGGRPHGFEVGKSQGDAGSAEDGLFPPQFAKVHGGPVRTVLQYVQFGISVPVTFPYAGDSREDVQKAAEALPYATRAEAVAKQISDILRYDSGLDDETRERVAARLAENFSVVTR